MLNTIDLFVGCGGLSEGFEQSRKYKMIGAVEWEPSPVKELRNHLKNRWGIQDSEERVLQFDIQRTEELFNGYGRCYQTGKILLRKKYTKVKINKESMLWQKIQLVKSAMLFPQVEEVISNNKFRQCFFYHC